MSGTNCACLDLNDIENKLITATYDVANTNKSVIFVSVWNPGVISNSVRFGSPGECSPEKTKVQVT